MKFLRGMTAAALTIAAVLTGSAANAATQITFVGPVTQSDNSGRDAFEDVLEGTLSVRGIGIGSPETFSYEQDVELAGTGFFAPMSGIGRFRASGRGSTLEFVLQSNPDADGFIRQLYFRTPLPSFPGYDYDQVFAENTPLGPDSYFDLETYWRSLSFNVIQGDQLITIRSSQQDSTYTLVSNSAVPFVPLATAAVPEPATWAMMIAGFGAVGTTMRRRTRAGTRVKFA